MSERETEPPSSRGPTPRPISMQNVHGVQLYGAPLNLAGNDIHNHTHHHYPGAGTYTDSSLLSVLDHVDNQRGIQIATLGRATKGTGMWIRQFEKWAVWLDPNGFLNIMWGYGMPGAGKTILASIVTDLLENRAKASTSPICVCYIYFRYSDHTKSTVRGFLEILIKQTIQRHPHCLPLFEQAYSRHILENTQPSEDELLALLCKFTGTMSATFFVLDAIDEAPPAIQLELVKKLASIDAKLFITSRPLKALEIHFPKAYRFEIFAQDQDIDLHVREEVSRSVDMTSLLRQVDPAFHDYIANAIKAKCGGMFLHASLQLAALRECTSIYDVEETLEAFPVDIESLYLQTWHRILGQTPSKRILAKKVLVWVLNATRSLTVEELRHAVATCPETHKFEKRRLVQEDTLIGMCRGLVAVEDQTRLVRLVHYTAKDILQTLVTETYPHPHAFLSGFCMARLTECGFRHSPQVAPASPTVIDTQTSDGLLSYAYDSWPIHARGSFGDPSAVVQLSEFVESCRSFPLEVEHVRRYFFPSLNMAGPLHIAAFFDLPVVLASSSLQDPNTATQPEGATPLHLACMRNHTSVATELLRLPNIRVNCTDHSGMTALGVASRLGHEAVARLLLAHRDIDVNAGTDPGRIPLHQASYNGHEGMVKILLSDPRVKVNTVDGCKMSALGKALKKGHGGIVKLLLVHPRIQVTPVDLEALRRWVKSPRAEPRCPITELVMGFISRGQG